MGNAAGSGTVGPQGNHCCRYCTSFKQFIGNPDLKQHANTPVLRNSNEYQKIIAEVSRLRAMGHGYQGKADKLLTDNGYTEGLISCAFVYLFFIVLGFFFFF